MKQKLNRNFSHVIKLCLQIEVKIAMVKTFDGTTKYEKRPVN